jgi:hypothetical protein
MSDENNLWECDKKKIIKEFSNPVGKLIKDIKVDVERQNAYEEGKKHGAVEELARKHKETLKIIYDVIGLEFSFKNKLIETLEKAQKERLKELKEKGCLEK